MAGKNRFAITAKTLGPRPKDPENTYRLQALLGRYGYLSGAFCPGEYDETTRRAVHEFQTFYRLYPDEDGVCDHETIELLNRPRCGNPDPSPASRRTDGRLAPFVTVGASWPDRRLRYRFLNATPDFPVDRQQDIIRDAFRRWAEVCALEFEEVAATTDSKLSVAFHRGSHGDGYPFDDAGGADGNTLAHAFFPPPSGGSWAGSLHFDEFEDWKDQPGGAGIRLFNVALHEIGHLLGLDHSQDATSIMYAYYAEDRNDLRPDDIAGAQSLYGAPQEAPVAIVPGERVSGHLQGADAEQRYQVTLQNKLLIRLDGPAGEDFDIYVRQGDPVDRAAGQYDHVSWSYSSDELITVDDPQPGTYHILVHSYRGAGSYSLEVEVT